MSATAPRSLICDVSGKICAPVSAQLSSKTDTSKTPVKELGSLDHAAQIRIDGASAADDDSAATENPSDWVVHAYKSHHWLEVYFKGHLYRTYHAVFGRSLAAGAKLWEGDRRTPEGNYLIVSKHRSARFGWFLHINYPNERDHERFEQSRAEHLIPASASEGGQIGIHGTDSPYLNVANINWTTGCISVDNADIGELARLLPVGTLVIINP
ncbi:MAG: L,D-transpeptidase [Deltaproteobacteria bacterium]|nr:L,D-transpeptidase [Deltaproteobacteria bacterium]